MDPDVGLGIGQDKTTGGAQRPRPSVFVRGLEMAGLGLVIYGLATSRIWLAAVGGAMILGSYALYRRTHGSALDRERGNGPDGPDADGGGD
jgi:hypothetical protein